MSRRGGTTAALQQGVGQRNRKNVTHPLDGENRVKSVGMKAKSPKTNRGHITDKLCLGKGGVSSITPDDSGQNSENNDCANHNDNDGDDNETDESDKSDEFAPSETHHQKRGHQTGLSVSLSNTKIDGGVTTRKRAWSNRVHDEDEVARPAKTPKPLIGNQKLALDDEDNYDAVDLISESDDDDNMEKDEEKLIIQSEEENDNVEVGQHPRSETSESWDGFPDCDVPTIEEDTFFSEHFARTDSYSTYELYSPDAKVFPGFSSPTPPPAPTRRVRFVDDVGGSSPSTSNETEVDQNTFPDLFMQQDKLDPSFRKLLEQDSSSDSGESYWDLENQEDVQLELERINCIDQHEPNTRSTSSGYETDEGETTDEEVMTPATVNRPQAVLRLDSEVARSRAKAASSIPARRGSATSTSNLHRRGPSIGSWVIDPTKAVAIVDKTGKNMIFYPAQRPRQANNQTSTTTSVDVSPTRPFSSLATSTYESENDRSDVSAQGMLVQSPANLMMSGLFGNNLDPPRVFNAPVVRPPEAFYPWRAVDTNGDIVGNDDDPDDDEEDALEANLNIHDFIDFGEGSGSETDKGSSLVVAPTDKAPRSPHHPTAFRRNQLRVNSLTSGYQNGPARHSAIKGGHFAQANEPISPVRKQKQRYSRSNSFASLGGAITQKRIETVKDR